MKNLEKYLEIGNNFSKASKYVEYATVQKQVLNELFNVIPNHKFESVLELGCGLCNNQDYFKDNLGSKAIYLNDLVESDFVNLPGNMLEVEFPSVDLVVSSSALHWLESDIDKLFDKVYNSLNEGGMFIFSIYTKGNVSEVEGIIDNLCYYSNEEIIDKLNKRFKVEFNEVNEKVKEFEKPLDVLREFKNTGTTRGGASVSDIKNFKENKLTYKYSLFVCTRG